uniref:carbonic anhydrase n=1 Tax=Glycomyces dulcitolivorans TaxID=2200759 RepID=UPI0018E51D2E
ALGLAAVLAGARSPQAPAEASSPAPAAGAWDFLMEGNRRWAADRPRHPHDDAALRHSLVWSQRPRAIVFTCIDSRVPPEYLFDAGNGDLMDVRTAAHTLDPMVAESLAYGPVELGTPLLVVLGHQHCGAVTLAWNALHHGEGQDGFGRLVAHLAPAYEASRDATGDPVDAMTRAHTTLTAASLRDHPALAQAAEDGDLEIVGAYYSLETGAVEPV